MVGFFILCNPSWYFRTKLLMYLGCKDWRIVCSLSLPSDNHHWSSLYLKIASMLAFSKKNQHHQALNLLLSARTSRPSICVQHAMFSMFFFAVCVAVVIIYFKCAFVINSDETCGRPRNMHKNTSQRRREGKQRSLLKHFDNANTQIVFLYVN